MTDDATKKPDPIPPLEVSTDYMAARDGAAIPEVDVPGLTPAQSADVLKTLYPATLNRLAILVNNLVDRSQNGDTTLWIMLDMLHTSLGNLKWDQAEPNERLRLLALVSLSLRRYADLLHAHAAEPATANLQAWQDAMGYNAQFMRDAYETIEQQVPR
jgi:hypothetical protein